MGEVAVAGDTLNARGREGVGGGLLDHYVRSKHNSYVRGAGIVPGGEGELKDRWTRYIRF